MESTPTRMRQTSPKKVPQPLDTTAQLRAQQQRVLSPMKTPVAADAATRSIYVDSDPSTPNRNSLNSSVKSARSMEELLSSLYVSQISKPATPVTPKSTSMSPMRVGQSRPQINSTPLFKVPSTPTTSTPAHVQSPSFSAPVAAPPAMPTEDAIRAKLKQFVSSWSPKYHENYSAYREGGYLAVKSGDLLDDRYEIIHKLGWGEFSTVWLAYDQKAASPTRAFVALKVSKCSKTVIQGTKYEMNLLSYLRGVTKTKKGVNLATMLGMFEQIGQYGSHMCMVLPVLGPNLLCVVDQMKARKQRRSQREYLMIKAITRGILQGLAQLDALNVVHTDLKPENVLCSMAEPKVAQAMQNFAVTNSMDSSSTATYENGDPTMPMVTLADFGLSFLLVPPNSNNTAALKVGTRNLKVAAPGVAVNTGVLIQTREYRSPEILFGNDFSPRTDIWSVACIVFELVSGDFLLDPKRKTRVEKEMDIEHVAMMMQLIGEVPLKTATSKGKHIPNYFDGNGKFLHEARYAGYQRRVLSKELEPYLGSASESTSQFITACLGGWEHDQRPSAADLLDHPWLKS